eukprot:gnl/TRDRNA2_/TRDRNA2_166934_c4_seq1.p1 gnl/TRDRNA2_/TRDRNA2_166934_c4~~gnl/TRDRNA2_/TRDRNA2_166934_c4_seq1.p1  ORF type:complete len:117 (-),score=19.10 gnl/TRDRNA2_/TRDRNA2_166934_c4_seq1:72-371(-)
MPCAVQNQVDKCAVPSEEAPEDEVTQQAESSASPLAASQVLAVLTAQGDGNFSRSRIKEIFKRLDPSFEEDKIEALLEYSMRGREDFDVAEFVQFIFTD